MGNMESSARKLGNTLKTAFTATAIIAVGRAVMNVASDLQQAYAVQERAERKLAAAVSANPMLDGGAARRLQEFASELQSVTTIGDETTISMAGMLASMGRSEEQITGLIEAAADLSAATGISLDSAIRNLNKTFGGLTGELGELMPELKNLTAEQLMAGEAVRVVGEQFAGMSEAMRDTTEGSMKSFANAWGDLKEEMGEKAARGMQPIRDFFRGLIEDLTESIAAQNDFIANQQTIQRVIADGVASRQDELGDPIQQLKDEISRLQSNRIGVQIERNRALARTSDPRAVAGFDLRLETISTNITTLQNELKQMLEIQTEQQRTIATEQEAAAAARAESERRAAASEAAAAAEAAMQAALDWTRSTAPSSTRLGNAEFTALSWLDNLESDMIDLGLVVEDVTEPMEKTALNLDGFNEQLMLAYDETLFFGQEARAAAEALEEMNRAADEAARRARRPEGTPQGAGGTGRSDGLQGTYGIGGMDAFGGGMGGVLATFGQLATHFQAIAVLADPVTLLMKGLVDSIGGLVNSALAPVIGMIVQMGVVLGHVFRPALELLTPMIQKYAEAWVWLYNNVFVPVHNAIRAMWDRVFNFIAGILNGIIGMINNIIGAVNKILPKRWEIGTIGSIAKREIGGNDLDTISLDDITSMGTDATGGGDGTPANYTTGRNITVNIDIFSEIIAGEGGIRDLSLMIRDEIRSAEALGA